MRLTESGVRKPFFASIQGVRLVDRVCPCRTLAGQMLVFHLENLTFPFRTLQNLNGTLEKPAAEQINVFFVNGTRARSNVSFLCLKVLSFSLVKVWRTRRPGAVFFMNPGCRFSEARLQKRPDTGTDLGPCSRKPRKRDFEVPECSMLRNEKGFK